MPISERSACVEDRTVPGHWEGDLLFGDAYNQIATLVERHTRYVMLVKLVDKDSYTVGAALARHTQTLPRELYLSLTWGRGSEMVGHKRFTLATDIQVYFCDPQNPCSGAPTKTPMNCCGKYLPKGIDLSAYSKDNLDAIVRDLNQRPRKLWGIDPLLKCLMSVLRRSLEFTAGSSRLVRNR